MTDNESDEVWQEMSAHEALILAGIVKLKPSNKELSKAIEKMNRIIEIGDRWALIQLCDVAIKHFHNHNSITFGGT
jgi:hypothetical protein